MDGQKTILSTCAAILDMKSMVRNILLQQDHIWLCFADTAQNPSIPQSLSKPVYWHNAMCSGNELTFLECRLSPFTGNINDVTDVTIMCKKRK